MSDKSKTYRQTESDKQKIKRICKRFTDDRVNATVSGQPVDFSGYLTDDLGLLKVSVAEQLVLIDMEFRLKLGESALIEDYFPLIPELKENLSIALIYSEFRIRRKFFPTTAESYKKRFPDRFKELVEFIRDHDLPRTRQIDQTIRDAEPASVDTKSTLVEELQELFSGGSEELKSTNAEDKLVSTSSGYQLAELLGRGQFGEVWRAEAPGGVDVAIKIIPFPAGHKTTDQELSALEVMKKLRHSFLMQVQAYWVDEEQLYIVLELGDETLQDLAERHAENKERVPADLLVDYFKEAAEAVDFLHSENILHRDLKPANILLVSGHVKVADFGIARVLGKDEMTVTATTMGTPLYMAPEVWQGKASPRSDQYSLAMTYAELRMGRPPYSSKSLADVMDAHLKRKPDLSLLTQREQRVLKKALAKAPHERYASCAEFASQLDLAVNGKTTTNTDAPKRSWVLIALLVLICAASSIFAVMLAQVALKNASLPKVVLQKDVTIEMGADPKEYHIGIENVSGDFDLEFNWQPNDKQMSITSTDQTKNGATCRMAANLNAQETYLASVRLVRENETLAEQMVNIKVVPPKTWRPNGCQRAEDSRYVKFGGRFYDSEIEWEYAAGQRASFLLITPAPDSDDPNPFYILETKVTNDIFRQFADSGADLIDNAWEKGGIKNGEDLLAAKTPNHPVYRVHHIDADKFAQWVGKTLGCDCLLPSVKQWQKAAGLEETEFSGPFNRSFETLNKDGRIDVAFDRRGLGPISSGKSAADISIHGCRDMAGNGLEWTRTTRRGVTYRTIAELHANETDDFVVTMSQNYAAGRPFLFHDPVYVKNPVKLQTESTHFRSHYLSFRVIIELPM